ncbi:MAG: CAP domain-containing protein [Planctomycetes bacterium]|nr:CAP domain-containing protein [Planctomycetota bacterium]
MRRLVWIAFAMLAAPAAVFAQSSQEAEFLRLINQYRQEKGLQPLVLSPKLTQTAVWMSQDMAAKDYMSHTDSLGRDPFQRMATFGYAYNTYKGENLAAGMGSAREAFIGWKNSPGHNANMLKPEFKAIGIARVYNSNSTYGYYWTTTFGGYVDGVATTPPATPTPGQTTPRAETPQGPSGLEKFHQTIRDLEPWSSFGIFNVAAVMTDRILLSGTRGVPGLVLRNSLPIAAGVAAVQLARGGASPMDIAVSSGSFAAAGLAVGLIADPLIYGRLLGSPLGWGATAYTLAKWAAIWFLGSQIERQVKRALETRAGVKQRLDVIAP